MQESTWKVESAPKITGKNFYFIFFRKGHNSHDVGVGVLVARKWIDKMISLVTKTKHWVDQLLYGKLIINMVCIYAPHPYLSVDKIDRFYEQLLTLITSVIPSETLYNS